VHLEGALSTAFIYKSSVGYELVMRLLYGRYYASRYRVLAELIPDDATVLDVCCGPATLYRRYLRSKSVRYTGFDVNGRYMRSLSAIGARGEVCDVSQVPSLPPAEIVVMQASLYHFLPDARPMVEKMLVSTTHSVIISEPVRNLADSSNRLIASSARWLTNAGDGPERNRFTELTLDELFAPYQSLISRSFLIPGGREKVFVLEK
jgi:Ribosomal RNA methyltransferase (FmrO)